MMKIIKRGFDIFNDQFDLDGFRYRVLSQIDNIRYGVNYPIKYDITTVIKTSEKDPVPLDQTFVRRTSVMTNSSPVLDKENVTLPSDFPPIYFYMGNLYIPDKKDLYTESEMKLLIKEHYYKHNEKFRKLKKEVQLFETTITKEESVSREPIPEHVRFSVWRRDQGKCVQCGSNKDLEFDHIIPVSKGGSSTERNLQLLCEKCNREKSAKI
jgi:hypothetical protein